ncbi:MAG: hypothetical protein JWP94_1682 [Mucilaginibacter sp.]|nr:hypothetical protein [Mucilaginibacter sp.]
MKKVYLLLITILAAVQFSHAQWAASGTNIYNTNTGKVGIGTSSPAAQLTVQKDSAATQTLYVNRLANASLELVSTTSSAQATIQSQPTSLSILSFNHSTTNYGNIYTNSNNSSLNINGVQNGPLVFSVNNNEVMRMLPSGNIGIGSTTPSQKLQVGTGTDPTGIISLWNAYSTSQAGQILFKSNNNFNANIGIAAISTVDMGTVNESKGSLIFATGNQAAPAEHMRIDNLGNVGIGTTSPGANLDIQGTGTVLERILSFGSIATLQLRNSSQTWSVTNQGTLSVFDETAGLARISVLSGTGNVGIGTTTPGTYKLAVNGNVHAQQVSVDLTGWGDYVFDRDYTLPSLTQIKTYIDQNHHLPDIPSEQQIIKDGLNLGEINKLLVKKVEELTLYLIAWDEKEKSQDIKIDKLEQRLALLEKQIANK